MHRRASELDGILLLRGDARRLPLADASVQCVVCSPPYWGLRDYGLPPSVWGGEADCAHEWGEEQQLKRDRQHLRELGERLGCGGGNKHSESPEKFSGTTGAFCVHCGAWRGCLGLEPTPGLFVKHIVEMIFREVRRVLRPDGVLWLNFGDSYCANPKGSDGNRSTLTKQAAHPKRLATTEQFRRRPMAQGLKPKDLIGMPWTIALALRDDGWWLRSDCIWSKPNCMPSSVTDRPTTAHEYFFLLTKQERYFYDAVAVMEKVVEAGRSSGNKRRLIATNGERSRLNTHMGSSIPWRDTGAGRNMRTVWHVASQPFRGAHFATFPPKLIERCIKSGTSERGACPDCAAPWRRVVHRRLVPTIKAARRCVIDTRDALADRNDHGANRQKDGHLPGHAIASTTLGFRPSCDCYNQRWLADVPQYARIAARGGKRMKKRLRLYRHRRPAPERWPTAPCLVLDPFGGAGTTALVSRRLGRRCVSIDLSEPYLAMARQRIEADARAARGVAGLPPRRLDARSPRATPIAATDADGGAEPATLFDGRFDGLREEAAA